MVVCWVGYELQQKSNTSRIAKLKTVAKIKIAHEDLNIFI